VRDIDIFQQALGLTPPWKVVGSNFNVGNNRLDLYLDFPKGSTFSCSVCGEGDCKPYDTKKKTWRHLDFFQHKAYIHARVPRVNCPEHGIKTVKVPWGRPKSGFTLMFEAYIMTLAKEMPIGPIAQLVGEHDTRIWRIIHHYVGQARAKEDYSDITKVGLDETSRSRGHNYCSIFVDLEKSKVIFAVPGKKAEVITNFKSDFEGHKGISENVKDFCVDMSPAFIAGIERHFPNAKITFDKFHIMKIINEAVDQVRREEQLELGLLKATRYIWLKNPGNLTKKQEGKLNDIKKMNTKTLRAYHLKLAFQEFFDQEPADAPIFLQKWYFWATHSRLEPMKKAAATIKKHWPGIVRWFVSRVNNGILEGLNSLIQAAKRRARGYRTVENLIAMVYLIGGKLSFDFHTA